jgi:hypothetical protein
MRAPTGRLTKALRKEPADSGLLGAGVYSSLEIGKQLVSIRSTVLIICPVPAETPDGSRRRCFIDELRTKRN